MKRRVSDESSSVVFHFAVELAVCTAMQHYGIPPSLRFCTLE